MARTAPAVPLRRPSPWHRWLLGPAGVLAAVLLVVESGSYASFSSPTANGNNAFSAGSVALADIGTNQPNDRLSVAASGLLPGDIVQRAVTLRNTGTAAMSSATLTTDGNPSSGLDTDTTNGLQLSIDRCSVAWTESGTAPNYTYSCSGTSAAVLPSQPVIGTNLTLNNLVLTSGTDNYLRVTLTLPNTAGDALQNSSSTIGFTFTGIQ